MKKSLWFVLLGLLLITVFPVIAGDEDFVVKDGVLTAYTGSEKVVTIPNGVKEIADGVFSKHFEIREIIVPGSMTTIKENAFKGLFFVEKFSLQEGGKASEQVRLTIAAD